MKKYSLIPKFWRDPQDLQRREAEHPFFSLQHEMNRLFDDFFGGFALEPAGARKDLFASGMPKIDVSETETEIRVEADLPGLDEKEIEIHFSDNVLTISGEKKSEEEEKKKDFYRMERSYGSFYRAIPIDAEVDSEKIKASLKKGVLSVMLPKTARAKKDVKRITISGE